MPIYQLLESVPIFPPQEHAGPEGLLAVGGDLSTERLLEAYRQGIFPWYEEGQPILWWSPDPRLIIEPDNLKISRSLRKTLKKQVFQIKADTAFAQVIEACSAPRAQSRDTWITSAMKAAYHRLHELGYAHSIESWHDGKLVGGLYGVYLGKCFFGESMFSWKNDASKVAFVALLQKMKAWQVELVDCQVTSEHLLRLGAHEISRPEFLQRLQRATEHPTPREKWDFEKAD